MYDELIKRLRECTAEMNGEKTLWHQAADVIEELQKDLKRSKDFETFWQHEAEKALKKFQVAISKKPQQIHVTEMNCASCKYAIFNMFVDPCCNCNEGSEFKPKTKADDIRSMTDEELAEFLFRTFGRPAWCLDNNCPPEESCVPCWLEWLKQERENLNEQTN